MMTVDSPMTPPERDATDAYEAHLDEVQDTPIREPGGKAGTALPSLDGFLLVERVKVDEVRVGNRIWRDDEWRRVLSIWPREDHTDVKEADEDGETWTDSWVSGQVALRLLGTPDAATPGVEFVDPSVVERVKGMPPLDKGEG